MYVMKDGRKSQIDSLSAHFLSFCSVSQLSYCFVFAKPAKSAAKSKSQIMWRRRNSALRKPPVANCESSSREKMKLSQRQDVSQNAVRACNVSVFIVSARTHAWNRRLENKSENERTQEKKNRIRIKQSLKTSTFWYFLKLMMTKTMNVQYVTSLQSVANPQICSYCLYSSHNQQICIMVTYFLSWILLWHSLSHFTDNLPGVSEVVVRQPT